MTVYFCIEKRDNKDYLIHINKDYDEFRAFFNSQPDKEKFKDPRYEFRGISDEEWKEFISNDEDAREFFETQLKFK